jgi:hypothetical protein
LASEVSGAAADQNSDFFQFPRWLTVRKSQRMVAGAKRALRPRGLKRK